MGHARVAIRLLLLMAAGPLVATQVIAQDEATRWKAQWITAAGAAERDVAVVHFRKTIELAAKPEKFVVDVSA
ncbi:MAG TPA: hypothetical protein VFP96_17135, partial [Candidatus Acidoferrum sp.]|nr:hypothetical protein [Candidatus Acidoferrum sp.]